MELPLYQLDAFTDRRFAGNPAAVVPLDRWLDDATLQNIARENNLSETAYLVGRQGRYELRWFTPTQEIDLCGHATLASAWVVLNRLDRDFDVVRFVTRKAGELEVMQAGERLSMDFPARPPEKVPFTPPVLVEALGRRPQAVLAARDWLVVYESEEDVRALAPDFGRLATVEDKLGVIVTAPGRSVDFVSRFFAPRGGVPEDPVTGSAHCTLVPYWSQRLGRPRLHARQVSARGGELFCEDRGSRVTISGCVVLYLEGRIQV